MQETTLSCRKVVGGINKGKALVAYTTLSFWGEFDPITGKVNAIGHPFFNQSIKNRIIIMKSTKGSSGTPESISLACQEGHRPAAFIVEEVDALLALGCVENNIPLVTDFDLSLFDLIKEGQCIEVDAENGLIKFEKH
jgi:predicted aconitase with swiveling domain